MGPTDEITKNPKVTVGLSVANDIQLIEFAVRSVFAQSEDDWELIIICDGAPSELVERMVQISDPRVTVVIHDENRGLAHRLNEIATLASGKYLARMDADDVMHPSRLALQLARVSVDDTIDVLGSGSYLITNANSVCGRYKEPGLPDSLNGYLDSGVFSHPTVLMRTAWALENRYDESWVRTEDKELWLRTAEGSRFEKIDDKLLYCRVPISLSIAKQALTAKWDRKLILDKGSAVATRRNIVLRLARSHVKQGIFWLGCNVGMSRWIHSTKYIAIAAAEKSRAIDGLSAAIHAHVPGWD